MNIPSGKQVPASIFFRNIDKTQNRDSVITDQVLSGNIPNFLRSFVPVEVKSGKNTLTYYVMPDYLSIGTDTDYVHVPLGAPAAQKIADAFGCILPTSKMSDQIWKAAKTKLPPKPMSGMTSNISGKKYNPQQFLKSKMSDTDSFIEHSNIIQRQMKSHKPGELVAGSKKDIVISNQLGSNSLGLHGFHDTSGKPLQPGTGLTPHSAGYSDYSSGIRLIDRNAKLNGKVVDLKVILKDPVYASMISDEGVVMFAGYKYDNKIQAPNKTTKQDGSMLAKNTEPSSNQILEQINKLLNSAIADIKIASKNRV